MKQYIVLVSFILTIACAPVAKEPTNAIKIGPSISELAEEFCNAQIEGVAEAFPYFVDNPKGLILFIPQLHRSFGSTVLDPVNNNSAKVQQEIFVVLEALVGEFNVPYIGVEGETVRVVERDHSLIDYLNRLLSNYQEIKQINDRLCGFDDSKDKKPELVNVCKLMQLGVDFAEHYYHALEELEEASIRIKRGPIGDQVMIAGIENVFDNYNAYELYQRQSELMAQITYLELKEYDKKYGTSFADSLTEDKVRLYYRIATWLETDKFKPPVLSAKINLVLLDYLKKKDSLGTDLDFLRSVLLFNRAYSRFKLLVELDTGKAPSGHLVWNRYSRITDLEELWRIKKRIEKQLKRVIYTKREKTAVDIVSEIFKKNQFQVGVVIFGSAHTENFIKAFNQSGYSIIVLMTPSIASTF
jgi:hypothetical protein